MKYLAKGYIISAVCFLGAHIVPLILAILLENIKLAIIITVLLVIILSIIFFKAKEWYPKIIKKLSHQKFQKLKEKNNKTIYEQLYIKAYNDTAIEILKEVFNYNDIKNINIIDFDASYNKEYITFYFEYKKHRVYYNIYEDKLEYYIDSPEKYDHLKINKEYEKTFKINIRINDFNSIQSYLSSIVNTYKQSINAIDNFEDEVQFFSVDQKTMEEILDFKDFNKSTNIFLNILSIILIFIMSILTYYFIIDFSSVIEEEILRIILTILGVISLNFISVFAFVYSIYCIIKVKIIEKDIQTQNIDYIIGKPIKVKLIKSSVGYRHNVKHFCSGIELYFENSKKIKLIYTHYFDIPSSTRKHKIINLLLNTSFELAYYKNSKIIAKGMEKIRKKIK